MSIDRCFKVFYTKDIRKKKKIYSQGVLVCNQNRTKLFDSDGNSLLSLHQKNMPQLDQEYTLNNTYLILVDDKLPVEMYLSGKIFIHETTPYQKPKQKKQIRSLQKETVQLKCGLMVEQQLLSKLRQHQIEGVNFMYECIMGMRGSLISGCILADFMGLGKTLQTITLVYSMLRAKIIAKTVVVCPLTLVTIWQKQIQKWLDNKLQLLLCYGSGKQVQRTAQQFSNNSYRMIVASYQAFYRTVNIIGTKCDLVIFDEGHRLKNKKGKIFQKMKSMHCRKRILLTGTPIQNNLQQLYTCISLVNPAIFPSQNVFKNIFQKPIIQGMNHYASEQIKHIALQRTVQLANHRYSLKILPEKKQLFVLISLTSLQNKWYNRILKQKNLSSEQILSYLNQIRKLFTHPKIYKSYCLQKQKLQNCFEDCSQQKSFKIQFLLTICQQCRIMKQKLIIVSYFTQTLDFIGLCLEELGYDYCKLDGRLGVKQRHVVLNIFKITKDILLLSGKAGGTGLTLTNASRMIMMEPDWNPSNDAQVMGRIWRQGQQKQVFIYRLIIISSLQEKIIQRQQIKQNLSQKLIDQGNRKYDVYNFMNLKNLFISSSDISLTFPIEQNQKNKCIETQPNLGWNFVIYVHIRKSHNYEKKTNQFEQGLFLIDQQCNNKEQFYEEQQQQSSQDKIDENIEISKCIVIKKENNIDKYKEIQESKIKKQKQDNNQNKPEDDGHIVVINESIHEMEKDYNSQINNNLGSSCKKIEKEQNYILYQTQNGKRKFDELKPIYPKLLSKIRKKI